MERARGGSRHRSHLITNYEIWNNNPEKVFGVNLEWHEKNPRTHQALIMALLEATQWMDQPKNRMEVVSLIAQKSYVNAPDEVVKMSMTGTFKYAKDEEPRPLPDFNVFYRYANFPWLSHAAWFISQMYRWGQLEQPANILQTAGSILSPRSVPASGQGARRAVSHHRCERKVSTRNPGRSKKPPVRLPWVRIASSTVGCSIPRSQASTSPVLP